MPIVCTEDRDSATSTPRPTSAVASASAGYAVRHSLSTPPSRLSSPYLEVRSKTENLERLICDLDNEETPRATPTRELKKYVRRRYTDSRHPTKELPDVRLEVPENMSVQYPPIRKQQKLRQLKEQQEKEAAAAAAVAAKSTVPKVARTAIIEE